MHVAMEYNLGADDKLNKLHCLLHARGDPGRCVHLLVVNARTADVDADPRPRLTRDDASIRFRANTFLMIASRCIHLDLDSPSDQKTLRCQPWGPGQFGAQSVDSIPGMV